MTNATNTPDAAMTAAAYDLAARFGLAYADIEAASKAIARGHLGYAAWKLRPYIDGAIMAYEHEVEALHQMVVEAEDVDTTIDAEIDELQELYAGCEFVALPRRAILALVNQAVGEFGPDRVTFGCSTPFGDSDADMALADVREGLRGVEADEDLANHLIEVSIVDAAKLGMAGRYFRFGQLGAEDIEPRFADES